MSRYITAALLAMVACAALVDALPHRAHADNGIILRTGTVLSAGNRKLTIRDDRDDDRQHSFVVPSGTYITLNGKQVALDDLKPGYFARVSAKRSTDNLVAKAIEAGAAVANRF